MMMPARTAPLAPKLYANLRLLVVEDDRTVGEALQRSFYRQGIRVAVTESVTDGLQLIEDANFIEAPFDGVLINYGWKDARGCRAIQNLMDQCPALPVGMATGLNDLVLVLFARARGIPIFHEPLCLAEVSRWLGDAVAYRRQPGALQFN